METEKAKEISELLIRHYVIRKRIEKIRKSNGTCSEAYNSISGGDIFKFEAGDDWRNPCFILHERGESDPSGDDALEFDDMCQSCKNYSINKEKVNRISKEGASIKKRLTWKIKNYIKENPEEVSGLTLTTEFLFDSII